MVFTACSRINLQYGQTLQKCIKCYLGRRKDRIISPLSWLMRQSWPYCVQYAKCHQSSIISLALVLKTQFIWACHLRSHWSALYAARVKWRKFGEENASDLKQCSYDGAWYTGHRSSNWLIDWLSNKWWHEVKVLCTTSTFDKPPYYM